MGKIKECLVGKKEKFAAIIKVKYIKIRVNYVGDCWTLTLKLLPKSCTKLQQSLLIAPKLS